MKKLLLTFAILAATAAAACAQSGLDDYYDKIFAEPEKKRAVFGAGENVLYLGSDLLGATGVSGFGFGIRAAYLEYNRSLGRNWFWGVSFSYNDKVKFTIPAMSEAMQNGLDMSITSLHGMFYYRLPVVGTKLSLRMGAGVGAGYNDVTFNDYDSEIKSKFMPYLTVEVQWIYRYGNMEVKFSPLVLSPSRIRFSPVGMGGSAPKHTTFYDMFHLSFGYRF